MSYKDAVVFVCKFLVSLGICYYFDQYSYNPDHLYSYLWLLSQWGLKREVDTSKLEKQAVAFFPWHTFLAVYVGIMILMWYLQKKRWVLFLLCDPEFLIFRFFELQAEVRESLFMNSFLNIIDYSFAIPSFLKYCSTISSTFQIVPQILNHHSTHHPHARTTPVHVHSRVSNLPAYDPQITKGLASQAARSVHHLQHCCCGSHATWRSTRSTRTVDGRESEGGMRDDYYLCGFVTSSKNSLCIFCVDL